MIKYLLDCLIGLANEHFIGHIRDAKFKKRETAGRVSRTMVTSKLEY